MGLGYGYGYGGVRVGGRFIADKRPKQAKPIPIPTTDKRHQDSETRQTKVRKQMKKKTKTQDKTKHDMT